MAIAAEQFTDRITHHGEGAVWSETWGGLRCVDMLAGDVLAIDANGNLARHHLGTIAAMIRPVRAGLSIVATERSLVLWDERDETITPLTDDFAPEGTRLNEGTCAPDGSLFIGSLAYDFHPGGGALYRYAAAETTASTLSAATISNGIGFSPDGTRVYYVDSARHAIEQFTVTENHEWVDRRLLASIDEKHGSPDGLWVDEEGAVWVALYGGSAVRRYLPDGTLDEIVTVGARQVTSCTFGGTALFITTSRENLSDDDDPLAGCLFRAETGIRGLEVLPFIYPSPGAQL